jgi:hypothetical protein
MMSLGAQHAFTRGRIPAESKTLRGTGAKKTADITKRKFFLDLAEQWRDLASDAELLDRKRVMSAVTQIPDIRR